MTGRDRIFLIGVVVLVTLAAGWLMVVSPERKQAASFKTQLATATTSLAAANSQVASGSGAQAQYATAYSAIVSLGKAVPPTQEVPALIYQIAQAAGQRHVEFGSIVPATATGSSAGSASALTAAPTAFAQMPFTFTFNGTFLDLFHLLQGLDRFTVITPKGSLQVSGRLLTINGVKLSPAGGSGGPQSTAKSAAEAIAGTITATAYVLPAGQGLTAGATSSAPAGAATPSAATPASGEAPKSATPPAVARVTP
jgi:hypothetical protein